MPNLSHRPHSLAHPAGALSRAGAGLALCLGLGCLLAMAACAGPKSGVHIALATQEPWADEVSVDVDNDLGEVSIEVDPSLREPEVRVRRFGEVDGELLEAAEGVSVVREGGVSGQTLRVVARSITYPPAASFLRPTKRALSVDIRTPPVFGALVRNAGGAVRLSGLGGPIQVNNGIAEGRVAAGGVDFTDRARIVLRTDRPLREPLDLTSGEGGIELEFPEDSDLILSIAGAKRGTSVHAPSSALAEARNDPEAWSAKVGEGTAPAILKAGGGSVRVDITPVRVRRAPR